jgi:hypothetical protein
MSERVILIGWFGSIAYCKKSDNDREDIEGTVSSLCPDADTPCDDTDNGLNNK